MENENLIYEKMENGVALLDFNADWCAPCRAQKPIIQKISTIYENRVSIVEVNIDKYRELATKYMVQSIPTLIIFKDSKEVKRFVGLQSEENITKSLDKIL